MYFTDIFHSTSEVLSALTVLEAMQTADSSRTKKLLQKPGSDAIENKKNVMHVLKKGFTVMVKLHGHNEDHCFLLHLCIKLAKQEVLRSGNI